MTLWLAAASATFVLGARTAHADLIWGANGHPYSAYPGVSLDQQIDYLADLGLKSYRVNISDVRDIGPLIEKAKARGIAILPVLTPGAAPNDSPEAIYRKAYDMAFTLVGRFKNDVRVWELGNEEEVHAIIQPCEMQDDGKQYNCAWGPAGGLGELDYYGPRWAKASAVLKGLSDGTMAADPTALKAMGTAGWGHLGAFKRMEKDGIKWDISVWHMYGEDPEKPFKELAKYNRPIWVTEFNHREGSVGGAEAQAVGLKHWMKRLQELSPVYRVEAAHIYELMDETYWAPSPEAFMGLVELDKDGDGWRPGRTKPAYDAVKAITRNGADAGTSGSSTQAR